MERQRLEEEQRRKAERELELEHEEAARQEAERRAMDEERRQQELMRHEQDQQDKLRQGSYLLSYNLRTHISWNGCMQRGVEGYRCTPSARMLNFAVLTSCCYIHCASEVH